MVFDKTGTLTTEKVSIEGVILPPTSSAAKLKRNANIQVAKVTAPRDIGVVALAALVGCHSLTAVPQSTTIPADTTATGNLTLAESTTQSRGRISVETASTALIGDPVEVQCSLNFFCYYQLELEYPL